MEGKVRSRGDSTYGQVMGCWLVLALAPHVSGDGRAQGWRGILHRQRTRLAGSNGTETSKTLQRRTCMGVHLFFFFILNMGSHFDILNGTSIGNRPAHNLTFSVICSKRAGPFFFFEVGLCVA